MSMAVLGRAEARTALILESVLTTAAVMWWSFLLRPWRDDPYTRPELTLVLVLAVLTLSLWVFYGR